MPDRDPALVPGDPYLSLVVTARNDDHGGNLLGRMQAFVSGWVNQARRYSLPSELIIVEWNPPADRPRLADVLRWPEEPGPCTVRIIEVPPEIHARLGHAAALPLYQMIGKNVGIRRARGQFVLATNIDILFSGELVQYLAEQRLDPDRMYRIDRHDAMSDVPAGAAPEEQLEYCRTHLLRINRREGTYHVTPDGHPALSAADVAAKGSGILFGDGWFPVERHGSQEVFRWAARRSELLLEAPEPGAILVLDIAPGPGLPDGILMLNVGNERLRVASPSRVRIRADWSTTKTLRFAVEAGIAPVYRDPRPLAYRIFDARWESGGGSPAAPSIEVRRAPWMRRVRSLWRAIDHGLTRLANEGPVVSFTVFVPPPVNRMLKGRRALEPQGERKPPAGPPEFLHTNGCGDFTLLARERWFELRGYPEFDLFSMNLDSVFCYAAHHGGAPEEVLADPMRIYHIEHGTGSGWSPEGQAKLFRRIADLGLSYIDTDTMTTWAEQMRRLNAPMIFNREEWGMAALKLPETAAPLT